MKNLLLFCLLAFAPLFLFAQNNTTWFVPGCKWQISYLGVGGPGDIYLQYDGQVIIGGETCTRLKMHEYHYGSMPYDYDAGDEYFFARHDSVFQWESDHFILLYDFTRQVGDTIQPLPHGPNGYAIVEEIGSTVSQGIPVRYQKLRFGPVIFPGDTIRTQVLERIGGSHLIYWDTDSPITDVGYYVACYRDDEYPQQDCDTEPVAAVEPPLAEVLRLYPNPATSSSMLTLELPTSALPALFQAFDAQGKRLLAKDILSEKENLALPAGLAPGLLFAQVRSRQGAWLGQLLRIE